MESFYLGTLTNSRPPWPAIPPRSGQIPRFFPGFRQITQTHAMRNQKTTRCQQVENSQVRHTRTTPPAHPTETRDPHGLAVIRDLRLASDHHVRHGVSIRWRCRDLCRSAGLDVHQDKRDIDGNGESRTVSHEASGCADITAGWGEARPDGMGMDTTGRRPVPLWPTLSAQGFSVIGSIPVRRGTGLRR